MWFGLLHKGSLYFSHGYLHRFPQSPTIHPIKRILVQCMHYVALVRNQIYVLLNVTLYIFFMGSFFLIWKFCYSSGLFSLLFKISNYPGILNVGNMYRVPKSFFSLFKKSRCPIHYPRIRREYTIICVFFKNPDSQHCETNQVLLEPEMDSITSDLLQLYITYFGIYIYL